CDLRWESCWRDAIASRMKASFLALLPPLSLRSLSMASVMRSNHCEKTSSTGRREAVYPGNVPALCWAILVSSAARVVPIYIQAAIAASNDVEIRSFRHVTILRDGADSRPSFETRATARSSG